MVARSAFTSNKNPLVQWIGVSLASILLAGCGGGGTDASDHPNQPARVKSVAAVDAAALCAVKAAAEAAREDVEVSCDKGVVQYRAKTGELPVVLSRGPWLAQGDSTPTGAALAGEEGLDFGGGGGAPSLVVCPTILGASGRSGAYVDQLTFTCLAGGAVFGVGPFGGDGGGPFTRNCPGGFFAIGVQGGAGSFIDRLGFVCSNAAGQRVTTALTGGSGGSPFYFECAANQKLIGFGVRSGVFIDNLQPLCGAR